MRIVTKLTNQDDIVRWREEKARADRDNDYRGKLGCVGEPIADALDKVLLLITCPGDRTDAQVILDAAAVEARENLLRYANAARQDGADYVLADIEQSTVFEAYDVEVDVLDTLAEVAERGFDAALRQITGQCWTVSELTDEEL